MRIIDDLTDFPNHFRTVVTSGTFDGVHLGHTAILRQVAELANQREEKSVLLTFWPHPRYVLHQNDQNLKLLTTFDEKTRLVAETGIDYLVRIPFTEEFSQMEPETFVRTVLMHHLNVSMLVIGYDHHFGKDRKGNFEYLSDNSEKFGFELKEIPRQDIDHVGVSSTKIRKALLDGKMAEANALLGRNYHLTGQVVEGDKIGRSIGFPTANIWVPEGYKLIPKEGVYATRVVYEGSTYDGMANIGIRPTVNGSQKRIEVNLFNFEKNIYGEEIELQFIEKIRDEQKFDGLDTLKHQLKLDKLKVKELLSQ